MEVNTFENIDKVFIDKSALESAVAVRAQKLFAKDKIEYVDKKPFSHLEGRMSAQDFNRSKRNIYITEYKGEFFKRCPGAKPGLTCCNYFVLNLGIQCNMNCSYCYLQSYINSPVLTIYSNIEKALSELKEIAIAEPDKYFRVGTGETIDSLSLDEITHYSRRLIEFFRELPKWKLEFKTKSSKVDQFLDVEHAKNVICSWSMNPQNIIASEEHGTADLEDRIAAAKKCLEKGFTIAFHIDPMIWHKEWKNSYAELVEKICTHFSPQDLIYITVGALRFQPEQRHIMRERFPATSLVNSAEVFTSQDGKMRYDQNIRSEMFEYIQNQFKSRDARYRVSLCMEVPETWSMTMASSPAKIPELRDLFVR